MTTTETVKLAVKPLEWKHEDSADFALSILGTYFITSGRPDGRYRLATAYSNGALFDSVDEAKAAAQADYERRILSAIAPAGGEVEPVGWETDAEWELEQRAFNAANRSDVPEDVREVVADLWKQYCLIATPNPAPSGEAVPVAATLKAIDNHLRVQQQVAARSNLVGYAAEFYAALRHTLPDAIRAALSPTGRDAE